MYFTGALVEAFRIILNDLTHSSPFLKLKLQKHDQCQLISSPYATQHLKVFNEAMRGTDT